MLSPLSRPPGPHVPHGALGPLPKGWIPFAWALATIATAQASSPLAPLGAQEVTAFAETRITVQRRGQTVALRDLIGDGALELMLFDAAGVMVRQLRPDGTYAATGTLFPWQDATVGWDLADINGDGRTEMLLVTDGKTLTSMSFSTEGGWGPRKELFQSPTYLPAGVARVPFARSIDGDDRIDLVLPGPGRFHLRLNRGIDAETGELGWSAPIEVGYEPEIDYDLGDPKRLSSTFGQSVRVPWFSMSDVDGDGTQDLVSETDGRVAFHLARPEIDALPTWELDLNVLKNDASASDIDLDDLLSVVSGFAQWRVEDLDGKQPKDLVIGSEGTFKLYLGGAATGPVGKPDQVLKPSGIVLYFFVRNVIGDERPDLQVVRGERISLARLLKYLVVPGQLDFDVFTYGNEGGKFARTPTKRTTLGLRVPRLFKLFKEFEQISEDLEAQWDIPARRLDWDGDGLQNDVVDAVAGHLVVYRNCAPEEQKFENLSLKSGFDGLIERVVLEDLDDLDDGGESVIDIGELDAFALAPGKALRDGAVGARPVAKAILWNGKDDRAIRARDLDGDGRVDFVTVVDGPGTFQVQLLVRK